MVNPCFADRYQEYMLAARLTRMALVRTLTELSDVPNIDARASATTFTSPASERLKAEMSSVGASIGHAQARIAELIAFLRTVEAKYEGLFTQALAERQRLENESR
jgi:hypothetical protein